MWDDTDADALDRLADMWDEGEPEAYGQDHSGLCPGACDHPAWWHEPDDYAGPTYREDEEG